MDEVVPKLTKALAYYNTVEITTAKISLKEAPGKIHLVAALGFP
jgi:hypothetical protein